SSRLRRSTSPCPLIFPYTTLFRSQAGPRGRHELLRPSIFRLIPQGDLMLILGNVSRRSWRREIAPSTIRIVDVINLAASAKEMRSEEHTSELQSLAYLVCRLLLEK